MSDMTRRSWEIRARICRRAIADEPVARIATLARISRDFHFLIVFKITEDGRLEGKIEQGLTSPDGGSVALVIIPGNLEASAQNGRRCRNRTCRTVKPMGYSHLIHLVSYRRKISP